MAGNAQKIPGPGHSITVVPSSKRIVVTVAGITIADSRAALVLTEASYPPVYYIPRADADMSQLKPSTRETYCPFKGECHYFSIPIGGSRSENAVWSYEDPYDAVAPIKDCLAFYADSVDAIEERDL